MLRIAADDEIAYGITIHHDLTDNNSSSLVLAREEYL